MLAEDAALGVGERCRVTRAMAVLQSVQGNLTGAPVRIGHAEISRSAPASDGVNAFRGALNLFSGAINPSSALSSNSAVRQILIHASDANKQRSVLYLPGWTVDLVARHNGPCFGTAVRGWCSSVIVCVRYGLLGQPREGDLHFSLTTVHPMQTQHPIIHILLEPL